MSSQHDTGSRRLRFLPPLALSAVFGLSACDDAGNFGFGNTTSVDSGASPSEGATETASEFEERDVEAPDVFFAEETGLWDGRPSLGGVWVAHPDVSQPERVRIRNNSNGQFVIGALFRRERNNPGPRLQLSSDAANAIGVLAGAPVELQVVALKKEKVAIAPPPDAVVAVESDTVSDAAPEPVEIEETTLDPIAAAEAAIESAPPTNVESEAVAAAAGSAPSVTSTLPETSLDNPYIQVGTFGVESNAEDAANRMSRAGLVPTVRSEGNSSKPSWRVVVGPAGSRGELQQMLKQVKDAGFSDAYVVPN